jgi:hypothetical protein
VNTTPQIIQNNQNITIPNENISNNTNTPIVNPIKPTPINPTQYRTLDFMNDPKLLQMFYVDLFNLDQDRISKEKFFMMYLIIENLLRDYSRKNGINVDTLSNPRMVAIIITLLDLGK